MLFYFSVLSIFFFYFFSIPSVLIQREDRAKFLLIFCDPFTHVHVHSRRLFNYLIVPKITTHKRIQVEREESL